MTTHRAAGVRGRRPVPGAAALALLLLLLAATSGAHAELLLEDQFGSRTDPQAAAASGDLAIVASDLRDSTERILAWSLSLRSLAPGLRVLGLADLKALPFFVPRGAVSRQLQRDAPGQSILLDWKGEAAARLGARKGSVTVFVFRGGNLRLRLEGDPGTDKLGAVAQALR